MHACRTIWYSDSLIEYTQPLRESDVLQSISFFPVGGRLRSILPLSDLRLRAQRDQFDRFEVGVRGLQSELDGEGHRSQGKERGVPANEARRAQVKIINWVRGVMIEPRYFEQQHGYHHKTKTVAD